MFAVDKEETKVAGETPSMHTERTRTGPHMHTRKYHDATDDTLRVGWPANTARELTRRLAHHALQRIDAECDKMTHDLDTIARKKGPRLASTGGRRFAMLATFTENHIHWIQLG